MEFRKYFQLFLSQKLTTNLYTNENHQAYYKNEKQYLIKTFKIQIQIKSRDNQTKQKQNLEQINRKCTALTAKQSASTQVIKKRRSNQIRDLQSKTKKLSQKQCKQYIRRLIQNTPNHIDSDRRLRIQNQFNRNELRQRIQKKMGDDDKQMWRSGVVRFIKPKLSQRDYKRFKKLFEIFSKIQKCKHEMMAINCSAAKYIKEGTNLYQNERLKELKQVVYKLQVDEENMLLEIMNQGKENKGQQFSVEKGNSYAKHSHLMEKNRNLSGNTNDQQLTQHTQNIIIQNGQSSSNGPSSYCPSSSHGQSSSHKRNESSLSKNQKSPQNNNSSNNSKRDTSYLTELYDVIFSLDQKIKQRSPDKSGKQNELMFEEIKNCIKTKQDTIDKLFASVLNLFKINHKDGGTNERVNEKGIERRYHNRDINSSEQQNSNVASHQPYEQVYKSSIQSLFTKFHQIDQKSKASNNNNDPNNNANRDKKHRTRKSCSSFDSLFTQLQQDLNQLKQQSIIKQRNNELAKQLLMISKQLSRCEEEKGSIEKQKGLIQKQKVLVEKQLKARKQEQDVMNIIKKENELVGKRNQKLDQDNTKLLNQISKMKNEIHQLIEDNEQLRQQRDKINSQIDKTNTLLNKTNKQLKQSAKFQKYYRECLSLEQQVKILSEQNQKLVHQLKTLHQHQDQLINHNNNKKHDQLSQTKLISTKQMKQHIQSSHEKSIKQSSNTSLIYKQLQKNNKKISDQNTKLSDQNTKLSEQNHKLTEENSKINQENSKINEENSKINEENSKINEENSKINQENHKLSEENQQVNNQIKQITQQNDSLTNQLNQCNTKIDQLNRNNQSLIQQLQQMNTPNTIMKQQMIFLQQQNTVLLQENRRISEEHRRISEEHRKISEVNMRISQENRRTYQENRRAQQENRRTQQENRRTQQEKRRIQIQNRKIQEQFQYIVKQKLQLQSIINHKTKENTKILNDNNKLLNDQKKLINHLKNTVYQLKTSISQLKTHKQSLIMQVNLLKQSVKKMFELINEEITTAFAIFANQFSQQLLFTHDNSKVNYQEKLVQFVKTNNQQQQQEQQQKQQTIIQNLPTNNDQSHQQQQSPQQSLQTINLRQQCQALVQQLNHCIYELHTYKQMLNEVQIQKELQRKYFQQDIVQLRVKLSLVENELNHLKKETCEDRRDDVEKNVKEGVSCHMQTEFRTFNYRITSNVLLLNQPISYPQQCLSKFMKLKIFSQLQHFCCVPQLSNKDGLSQLSKTENKLKINCESFSINIKPINEVRLRKPTQYSQYQLNQQYQQQLLTFDSWIQQINLQSQTHTQTFKSFCTTNLINQHTESSKSPHTHSHIINQLKEQNHKLKLQIQKLHQEQHHKSTLPQERSPLKDILSPNQKICTHFDNKDQGDQDKLSIMGSLYNRFSFPKFNIQEKQNHLSVNQIIQYHGNHQQHHQQNHHESIYPPLQQPKVTHSLHLQLNTESNQIHSHKNAENHHLPQQISTKLSPNQQDEDQSFDLCII